MLLRWDRAECLQAMHDEHERLGRPIRKFRKVPVDSIVDECRRCIENEESLYYSPDPEASPELAGPENQEAAAWPIVEFNLDVFCLNEFFCNFARSNLERRII